MHPATGYSVGAVLADVDRFLDRLAARGDASPPGGRMLAWLHRRGLHVILGFDADRTREFFDAFFTLPLPTQRAYLNDRYSVRGTATAMWAVFRALGWRQRARLVRATAVAALGLLSRPAVSPRAQPAP